MLLLIRLKAFLKTFIAFINDLPRQHFFALILLFVFLLVISFIPSQESSKKTTIKRRLVLPPISASSDDYPAAEPLSAVKEAYSKVFPDFSGNREIQIEIKSGDTLSGIFQKEGLSAAILPKLLEEDLQYLRLDNLQPGQKVNLLISADNNLLALKVLIDLANTLTFTLKDDQYLSLLETKKGEWRNSLYQGSITGSFYIDAKEAGLSAGHIQQVSNALQESFDFNSQFRLGDTFHILVSKQYIEGEYNSESEVLAIVIKTRLQNYTAFLNNEDGRYYAQNGLGLNKAYRRIPLDHKVRISSSFNPRRFHPITKRISPHNGTDFSTPTGTNVYSVGDGTVVRAGYHPAAGNYIVIKHGRKYTTRFLHLSKILVRNGQSIKMGALIAKTGNTGRSTGPHLHYEFHVYDRPVDAMKVDLPLSKEVPKEQMRSFVQRRDLFLKEMGQETI